MAQVTRTNPDGSGQGFLSISASAAVRGPKAGPNYRPPFVPQVLEVSHNDEKVAKVTRLWGTQVFDWTNLYRMFKIIEQDADGVKGIENKGWSAPGELGRFLGTAHNPAAAGDAARHRVPTGRPPQQPMDLETAKRLIESIVRSWLDWKLK
jgi:hypothetical protein